MFIPTGRGYPRVAPIVLVFFVGAFARTRDARRFCGIALLATAGVIAALTIAAALRPAGEPALSLWGNPLTSWRFFGLRNHLAAFVTGGTILGAVLVGWNLKRIAAASLGAIAIVGAPKLGANYVGVLTLTFAATLTILFLARKQPKTWHVLAALGASGMTMIFALLSDASAKISHGGRAVGSIRSGGIKIAWDIFYERAVLGYREVASLGVVGYLGFVAVTIGVILLAAWAWRSPQPVRARAAVAGCALAAFLALFVEDSGFFTGGILALYPAIGFSLAAAPAAAPSG
jgi:hypothetical protein